MAFKQMDCFKINVLLWKILAVWPTDNYPHYYKYYSVLFITIMLILYELLLTINFFFLPLQLDVIIEELMFYFTELSIMTKALTFLYMRERIQEIIATIESDTFQPDTDYGIRKIDDAKRLIKKCWKIYNVISYTSHLSHVLGPIFAHIFLPVGIALPVCSYYFIPENVKAMFFYPLYFYQSIGMTFHVSYNLNIDGFFLGLIILIIAQLQILDQKLRQLTNDVTLRMMDKSDNIQLFDKEHFYKQELNKCIVHFDRISKFCSLVQNVFTVPLFVQFSMSSSIICIGLFRFTMPAPTSYYIFLTTYMMAMIFQILIPCWFGTRVQETSSLLSEAVYNCNWIDRPRQFKSSLRLFVERMNKPLSITGLKMIPLSLTTFTSIMNTAYSFYTLLRHMQGKN